MDTVVTSISRRLQDKVSLKDSIVGSLMSHLSEPVNFFRAIRMSITRYVYNVLDTLDSVVVVTLSTLGDKSRLTDTILGCFRQGKYDQIGLYSKTRIIFSRYPISKTLDTSDSTVYVMPGSPVIFDKHKFDEVIFN